MEIGNKDKVRKLVILTIAVTVFLSILALLPTASAIDNCSPCMLSYWKLDENSDPVIDSFDGNDGTNHGAIRNQAGQVGNAYSFDGVDDYLEIPHNSNLDFGTGAFTLEAWIKANTIQTSYPMILSYRGSDAYNGYFLCLNVGGAGVQGSLMLQIDGINYLPCTTDLRDNNWHHVAATRTGTTLYFYVDGTVDGTATSNKNMNSIYDLWIGRDQASPSNTAWAGLIDEVAVYSCCLPASTIDCHYQSGLAHQSYCGYCHNYKMHYPQLPDEDGWDVSATYPVVLADDWQCTETGFVKDIHFWGSWLDNIPGPLNGFWVSIHADIPAVPPNPSMPGAVLWWKYIPISDIVETEMPPYLQGFYYPPYDYIPNNHILWYQYDIILDAKDWFPQEYGNIYWLDISADVPGPGWPNPPLWGWKTTNDHWNDDAFFGEYASPNPSGIMWWEELYEPPLFSQSLDLAFVITGDDTGCIPICIRTRDSVEFCTIQAAIDDPNTVNGDTIQVYPGTYTENAHNWVDIDVYKELTIIGQAGSAGTIIELNQRNSPPGAHMDGVSISASNVKIQGFTFTKHPTAPYASGFNIRAGINVHTPPPANTFNNITLKDVVSEYSYSSNVIFDGAYTYNNINIIDCNIHHSYTERCFYQSPNTIINGFTVTNSHFDYAGYGIPTSGDPIGFNLQGTTTNLQITGGSFNENPNGGIGIRRTTNAVIQGVSVVHSGYHASGTRSGIGIWEDVLSTSNVQIINPTVTNCGGRGLMFGTWGKTVQDITVTGGTISNSGNIGCMLYTGGAGGLVQRVKYTGLTVTNSGSHNLLFQEDDSSGASTCRYVNVTQCTITNSPGKGVYYYGMNVAGSLVNYNNIYSNVDGVFNVAGTGILDATCNWWGAVDGPSGVGTGSGDTVSSNVIYCLWLNAAYPGGVCIGGAVCRNINTGEYFCSIQKAIDDSNTANGHTIEVFAGTHPGNIIVYKEVKIKSQSGAAVTIIDANYIDYSGYKNAWGYGINYAWAQTNDPGLLKNGFMIWKNNVTIDGFKIINALWPSQYNRGIGILIGSIHTTYAGFVPWNIDQWGGLIWPVYEPKPYNIVIKNNIVDGASDGIYNWASNGNTFEYNTVTNSVAVGGVGIQCYEGGTDNIIRYNTIDNVDGSGISICGAWPDLLLDVSNTQIYNNLVKNSNYGIQFYNMYGSNVHAYHNNILANNKGVVVEGVGGALVGHANYNNIVGNTIGVENTAPDGVFDAECNWYGDILGPTHWSNPYGIGDSVSDNVDYRLWLNLPFENPDSDCIMGDCQDIVYVDDDYKPDEPGYFIDHFPTIQMALDFLDAGGTAIIYDGEYDEDLIINDWPCDNTGITIMGEYECFPTDESAVIQGHAIISVDDVTIKYLEFKPTTDAAITVEAGVTGTTLEFNKFRRDCITDAIGVKALDNAIVDAEANWWGAQDGPSGGMMDDGKTPAGNGVKLIGEVLVEPWIGIHAEISKPVGTIEVSLGTPVTFDATGSFAYSFGECCELTELPMQYLWDFGDGSLSSNMVATHIFEQTGTYQVALMVDSEGIPGLYANFMYDWAYVTVHVVTEDTTLTANADGGNLGGYETIVDEPVQLYGDAYGGNGEYIWHWNFGDQTADSNLQNPIHTYTEPGVYTVTLTVISDGETATDTAEVRVYDIDELFVTINDANTLAGVETMFAASIKGGSPPYTISWDFGDGSTSQETYPTHIYASPGEYTITVIVTDNKQKTDQDTAIITVEEENIIEEAEIKEVKAGLGVTAVIDAGESNCHWEITVEGKVFLGGENSGTIDANTQDTVRLGFSLAFGEVNIVVKAAGMQKEYTAFALGPLYFNLQEV